MCRIVLHTVLEQKRVGLENVSVYLKFVYMYCVTQASSSFESTVYVGFVVLIWIWLHDAYFRPQKMEGRLWHNIVQSAFKSKPNCRIIFSANPNCLNIF
jgi:hypothetical protein